MDFCKKLGGRVKGEGSRQFKKKPISTNLQLPSSSGLSGFSKVLTVLTVAAVVAEVYRKWLFGLKCYGVYQVL